MKKFNKKGFTIVELVIVIAVIGILAGVLIPTFSGITQRANETAAMQEAKAGMDSILILTNGVMPTGTMFYVLDVNDTHVPQETEYAFEYKNGELNAKTVADTDAPPYKNNEYTVYVSSEVMTKDSDEKVNGITSAYAEYIAKLVGWDKVQDSSTTDITYNTTDCVVATWTTGADATKVTHTINFYWSADLHDTLAIFIAGNN